MSWGPSREQEWQVLEAILCLQSSKDHSWGGKWSPVATSRGRELRLASEHFLWHLPGQQKQPSWVQQEDRF